MREIICRFNSEEDLVSLGLDIKRDTLVFDLGTMKVVKSKKNTRLLKKRVDKKDFEEHYVGMPEFVSEKKEPYAKVIFIEGNTPFTNGYSHLFDQNITNKTKSIWFPKLIPGKNARCRFIGGESNNKYPIYVISKGRGENCYTSMFLSQMEVYHNVVVEDFEVELYSKNLYNKYVNIIELDNKFKDEYDTFDDLDNNKYSRGSGPARNFCWSNSISNGFKRHWLFDDNANEGFHKLHKNNKIKMRTGSFLRSLEDFVDRYKNIAIAGLNYTMFCVADSKLPPYVLNTKIYSFLLIDNSLKERWRGRFNEDVDICIRVLKKGYCTMQFNVFTGGKATTQKIKGGNTTIYKELGTKVKSEMLEKMHPNVAKVSWRFNRWHHVVNYSGFKQKLIKKDNYDELMKIDNTLPEMYMIRKDDDIKTDTKSELERDYTEIAELR